MKPLLSLILIGMALLLNATAAFPRDEAYLRADHKIRGHEVQTHQQHAQDRAQTLYYYYQQPQPRIPQSEAREIVGGIRKSLTSADKALAKIKADNANNKDVLKQIALIEKHQAKAHEVCGMAEEECAKEHGDHVVCAECCSKMWHELDAAKAETQKLLKMLKIDKLDPPKKVEPGKETVKKEAPKKDDRK
jgi:regulator of RNase E activity RraB